MWAMWGLSTLIEPVPKHHRKRALPFLVGGRSRDASMEQHAGLLAELAQEAEREGCLFWWLRRRRTAVAAAMVLSKPGHTGMLFFSPFDAPGVEAEALQYLVRSITRQALRGGLCFVQAMVSPGHRSDIALLEEAGFARLAELIYMRMDLVAQPAPSGSVGHLDGLCWRGFGQFDEEELGQLIRRTYDGSLDSPALSGLREMADVIEGHKHGRQLLPEAWWIVSLHGQPAGCILVNDYPGAADVTYVGVTPEHRGKGLCAAMLLRAADAARRRGRAALTLAVDAANHFALRVYEGVGFREVTHRLAYMATATSQETRRDCTEC